MLEDEPQAEKLLIMQQLITWPEPEAHPLINYREEEEVGVS